MVERRIGPLHVADHGRGPAVVLLHGWATSGRVLAGLAARLAGRRRVVVPDLRGHGRSPPPPGPFSLEDHAGDVAALAGALGLERPILAGWSMGAQVALAAATRLGAAGLALLAPTARFTAGDGHPHALPRAQLEGLAARMRIHAPKALARFFAACLAEGEVDGAERSRALALLSADPPDTGAALGALDALAAGDQRASLPGLALPVLLVHGEADAIVPPGASEAMAAALPDARRVALPGAGHAPFLTRPDAVAAAAEAFLDALPGAAAARAGSRA
jgi:pimeloyl-[acyl-carrier protein] methyl ester esterase